METLQKEIKDFADYNGAETINHLNELIHNFTNHNDEIGELISIKREYANSQNDEEKNKHLKRLFDVMDGLQDYAPNYLSELRFSVNQTNKLITEILLHNAKNNN